MESFLYITRMQTPRQAAGCGRPSVAQIVWSVVFFSLVVVEGMVAKRVELPGAVRALLPVAPLVAGFFYMRAAVADTRRQLDELQLRIYLEAAAVVVGGLFVLFLTYPLMKTAGWVGPMDESVVLFALIGFGAIGFITARRRYR
jgi:hypothetical protein